jgi:hypothetical protein
MVEIDVVALSRADSAPHLLHFFPAKCCGEKRKENAERRQQHNAIITGPIAVPQASVERLTSTEAHRVLRWACRAHPWREEMAHDFLEKSIPEFSGKRSRGLGPGRAAARWRSSAA